MPLIFVQDTAPTRNWRAEMFEAVRNADHTILAELTPLYQKNQPVEFASHLTDLLHEPSSFLVAAAYVNWDNTTLLRIARELRPGHTEHAQLSEWIDHNLMGRSAAELQPWKLHWAGLRQDWTVIEPLLKNSLDADMLFFCVIVAGNKHLFEQMTPYARATLRDPIYVLEMAYERAHSTDDVSWIDPLLEQYSVDELSDEISASHASSDAFRSYIIQYNLKDLPESRSSHVKRL